MEGESFRKLRSGQAPSIGDVGIQDRRRFRTAPPCAAAGVHELPSGQHGRATDAPQAAEKFIRVGYLTVKLTLREARSIGYVRFERGFSRGVALVEGI